MLLAQVGAFQEPDTQRIRSADAHARIVRGADQSGRRANLLTTPGSPTPPGLRFANAASPSAFAETEERNTPDVVTADYAYYRYRKPTYTAEERRAMVARLNEHLAAGRDVFAYFKHEETPEGALYAVEVLGEVGHS